MHEPTFTNCFLTCGCATAADTYFALDFVQPEQLTLRVLMRSLGARSCRGRGMCGNSNA